MQASLFFEFEDNLPKHLTPLQKTEATMEYCNNGIKQGWWDNIPIPEGWVEGQEEPRPKPDPNQYIRRHTKNVAGTPPFSPRFFNCRSR